MNAILIDDESLALDYLEHQLMLIDCDIDIVGKFTDPIRGREFIIHNHVDLVFLDIQIPEIHGIELAEQILEYKPLIDIIFVTGYENYALKAFELNALDYLLKPVQEDRLVKTLERVGNRKRQIDTKGVSSHFVWKMSLFGEFSIAHSKMESLTFRWRTMKVRHLFFYLLYQHGKVVSKEDLIDLFWGDFEVSKAYSQLYTAIYHIRKTLKPFTQRMKLQKTAAGYVLHLEEIQLDAEVLEGFFKAKIPLSTYTITQYEEILELYKGEYLEGLDMWWVEMERERFRLIWIQIKMMVIDWCYHQKLYEKALQHCESLCRRYPLEEKAHFMYMKICDKAGLPLLVQRQYDTFCTILNQELNEKPSKEMNQWYNQWKKTDKRK